MRGEFVFMFPRCYGVEMSLRSSFPPAPGLRAFLVSIWVRLPGRGIEISLSMASGFRHLFHQTMVKNRRQFKCLSLNDFRLLRFQY